MAILFGALEIIIPKILTLSLKWQIKGMKKSGKMPYTPTSVIEFYDERWGETSEDTKTELSYSGIERISVVFEDAIYIQINNLMGYILPFASFETKEQYENFMDFIKSKVQTVEMYDKK